MIEALGTQTFVEYYNCDKNIIDDEKKIELLMNNAARISNATIIKSTFHRFAPQGVSGVIVIAESHFAIHTWPEHSYASVDLFTCGSSIDELKAIKYLKEQFNSSKYEVKKVKRGDFTKINQEKVIE
jgi:S-adenosylmethionine decarboxylase